MNRFLSIILIFTLISITVSCSSTPKVNVVDPSGRPLPNPHYTLKTIGEENKVSTMYYYTFYSNEKDLDGQLLMHPIYQDRKGQVTYDLDDTSGLTLTIEIFNPEKIKYSLWKRVVITTKDGKQMYEGDRLALSDKPYRFHIIELPLNKEFEKVEYDVSLIGKKGESLMHFGPYEYGVK